MTAAAPGETRACDVIGQAVVRMVEAEGFLEGASVLSPAAEGELLRLKEALHELGIEALGARGLLEKRRQHG